MSQTHTVCSDASCEQCSKLLPLSQSEIHAARHASEDPAQCGRLYGMLNQGERALLERHSLAMWRASTHLRAGEVMTAAELAKACGWGIAKARETLKVMTATCMVTKSGARYTWVPTPHDICVRAGLV